MVKTVKDMLAEANAAVPKISAAEAAQKMACGIGVLVVDVRDPSEVQQTGKLKGAVNVSRGIWNSGPTPRARSTTIRLFKRIKPSFSIALRAVALPGRQGSPGHGLYGGVQHRRLQGSRQSGIAVEPA